MKIALDELKNAVECTDTTPPGKYCCLVCDEPVFACNRKKKNDGRKKDYCFAHHSDHCTYNPESYFHKLAKEIILRNNSILLPDLKLSYLKVVVECTTLHAQLRPDVVVDDSTAIEIYYTNAKDSKQIEILKQLDLSAIEIDLSELDLNSTLAEVEFAVLKDENNREYLHKKGEHTSIANPTPGIEWLWIGLGIVMTFFGVYKAKQFLTKGRRSKFKKHRQK